MAEQKTPEIVKRLQRQRRSFRRRSPIYRTLWVLAGAVVLVVGIVMTVLPGPALVLIPIGLAMLSLQFRWAQHLLDKALAKGSAARDRAAAVSGRQKLLAAAVIICLVAAAAAIVFARLS